MKDDQSTCSEAYGESLESNATGASRQIDLTDGEPTGGSYRFLPHIGGLVGHGNRIICAHARNASMPIS